MKNMSLKNYISNVNYLFLCLILITPTIVSAQVPAHLVDNYIYVEETRGKEDWVWEPQQTVIVDNLKDFTPSVIERSKYGGVLSTQYPATGYIYTLKVNGRWWFVDPDGHLMIKKGINGLKHAGDEHSPFTSITDWQSTMIPFLQDIGINSGGGWTGGASMNGTEDKMCHIKHMALINGFFTETYGVPSDKFASQNEVMPVFHAGWVPYANAQVAEVGADLNDDPYFMGIFCANELKFNTDALTKFLQFPAIGLPDDEGYLYALNWLRQRKNDPNATIDDVTTEDTEAFFKVYVEAYYKTISDAVKTHMPNHLYLGSRVNTLYNYEPFMSVYGEYTDVISLNRYYSTWTEQKQFLDNMTVWGKDKPFIVTEFYAMGQTMPYFSNDGGAGSVVHTQTDRGYFYQNITMSWLVHKSCVGWDWFSYRDADHTDGVDSSNKGVVDLWHNPWTGLTDAMKQLNNQDFNLIDFFDNTPWPPAFGSDPIDAVGAAVNLAYIGTLSGSATDEDVGDTLTYSKVSGPAWLNVAADGTLVGTPLSADMGLNTWTVQVTDEHGKSDTASLRINVSLSLFEAPLPMLDSAWADGLNRNTPQVVGDTLESRRDRGRFAMIKVDTSNMVGNVVSAKLTVSNPTASRSHTLYVFGVNDSAPFQNWTGGGVGDVTYNSVTANGMFTANYNLYQGDPNLTLLDSQWLVRDLDNENPVLIDSQALVDFINTDTDGLVTFVFCTEVNLPTYIRSHTHANTPTLELAFAPTPNQPPVFGSDPINKPNAAEDVAYSDSIAGEASDPGGDPMTFAKASGPAWLSVAPDGTLSGTPVYGDGGANVFTVQVNANGGSDTATLNIVVDVVNDAPTFTVDPITGTEGREDTSYHGTISGSATDVDVGDTRTYSKVSGPAWLSVASDGTLSGTPANSDVGVNSFVVRVEDALLASADAALNITVQASVAPTFTVDPITGTEGREDTSYHGTISGSATDVDVGDTLTYSKVSGPAWLSVASDGALSGWPTFGDIGTNVFSVKVEDVLLASDVATLNITVVSISAPLSTDIYEAEDAVFAGDNAVESDNAGYTGTGYVDYGTTISNYVEWTFDAAEAGDAILAIKYANGDAARPLDIQLNGQFVTNLPFYSGGWTTYSYEQDLNVTVNQGNNTLRLIQTIGSGPNVDHLLVKIFGSLVPNMTYENWLSNYLSWLGSETNKTDNKDGDAANNLTEYALAGNPTNNADTGIAPIAEMVQVGGTNYIEYIHVQRNDTDSLDYRVETTTDLVSGTWTNINVQITGTNTAYGVEGFDAVTNRIPAEPIQQFIRLEIQ